MADTTIQASTFKARCFALLDEVASTPEPIVVTKLLHDRSRGR